MTLSVVGIIVVVLFAPGTLVFGLLGAWDWFLERLESSENEKKGDETLTLN